MKFRLPIFALSVSAFAWSCQAQDAPQWQIFGTSASPKSSGTTIGNTNTFVNGVMLSNEMAIVTADKAVENNLTGAVRAEGDVTIVDKGHIWRGTNIYYDFDTGQVMAGAFKTAQMPFNISGQGLSGSNKVRAPSATATGGGAPHVTNGVYTATNAFISTDDVAKPTYKIHARTLTIVVGEYFEAYDATLYLGSVPIFYWPHYRRYLRKHPENFEFVEGYRSIFGPYLLSAFNWYGNGTLDGTVHFDMRESRGLAGGPDLFLHLGDWGQAAFHYYYAYDENPNADGISPPHLGQNRQRMNFFYQVTPTTNFTAKVLANYQSDPLITRDFFENEYQTNVEPATFAEATQLWPNFTLDAMAAPRMVHFFETVERLPDVMLSGAPQQVGVTPIYYDSQSSVGYFRRAFSITNLPTQTNYEAMRADTFHQFTLPETFFGWLNVAPRVGARMTYYGDVEGPAMQTNQQTREIFNTGMDVSFKASRVYREAESSLLDVHELRHIIEPEVDYVFVPAPRSPSQVPQFDYQLPSMRLLPIEFPQYNNIDSIGGMNVVRLMLRNILQTKRADGVEDLINWAVYTDWNLTPGTNYTFSDLYSDLEFRPRSWFTVNTSVRYDLADTRLREVIGGMVLQPSTAWSLSLSYYYLMNNDPEFQIYSGQPLAGHNLFTTSFYYRMNENWAIHLLDRFEAQNGSMQEQDYSIYRDLRSWTMALTFRVLAGPGMPTDFGVALTMSLKAFPRFGLNTDRDMPSLLMGSTSGNFDPTLK